MMSMTAATMRRIVGKAVRSSTIRLPLRAGVRPFSSSAVLQATPVNKHVDTPDNNANTPFDFTPELYEEVYKILDKYPPYGKQSAILPLMYLAQRQCGGWVPLSAMNKIAHITGVPPLKVYEVATFYTMFNRTPVGKYHLGMCVTTSCMICGADDIVSAIEDHLGIRVGETTPDKNFTLTQLECVGACSNAPVLVVADYSNPPEHRYDYYEDITAEDAIRIIESLKKGVNPPIGPQNGRANSIPKGGRTSLFDPPPGPYCRDLDKA